MVPLLIGQLKLSQHRAHATSLAVICFIAASGVIGYWHAGNIEWSLAATLIPGAIVGTYAGTRTLVHVPARQLRLLFAAFLFFVAFRQLFWNLSAGTPEDGVAAIGIELAFGFAGGMLAGLLGVGGGAIFAPSIVIFGLAHAGAGQDPQKIAQGVSLVVIVCTGISGTLLNLRQQIVDVETATWVVPAAVTAAFLASLWANRLDGEVLKRVYGVVAMGLGLQMLVSALRQPDASAAVRAG